MNNEQNADESGSWNVETVTKPGTPKAKLQEQGSDRIVYGPGVYSDVYEDLGPLRVRTAKY